MANQTSSGRREFSSDPGTLRVIDLGTQVGGPFVATLLGDLGADVIKVEQPGSGDPMRLPDGLGPRWQVESRNKRSITLNLRVPEGQSLFRRLAQWADIVAENFRPGTMAKWGLGFDDLAKINPRLVLVSVSAYGQEGPNSPLPGYDHTGAAFGGLTYVSGPADRPPALPGLSIVDYTTGMFATIGALEAVRRRDGPGGSGRGEWVQSALYESVIRMNGADFVTHSRTGAVRERCGGMPTNSGPAGSPQSFTYQTSDGRWVASNPVSDDQFERLAKLVNDPELLSGKFATRAGRLKHAGELDRHVRAWMSKHERDQIIAMLRSADVPGSPVNSVADIVEHPHVQFREDLVYVLNARGETVRMPSVFPRLKSAPGAIRWVGEELGASNEEVYLGLLGITKTDYEQFRERRVI